MSTRSRRLRVWQGPLWTPPFKVEKKLQKAKMVEAFKQGHPGNRGWRREVHKGN